MNARYWHLLSWLSRCTLMAGIASLLYLLLPDQQPALRITVQIFTCTAGFLAFEEVWRLGGRMSPVPGLSQAGRLILRTAETASMLTAVLIVVGLL